jgi:Bifunctional DNA primase/polymerase, N-terminal/Primase C terminal 2 (PriCT-2)
MREKDACAMIDSESTRRSRPQSTLDIALAYVAKHPTRYLFPCAAGDKARPCIKNNLDDASNDPRQLRKWVEEFPGCSWACSPRKSGLICLDIDMGPGKMGGASFKALRAEGLEFPKTEVQGTPSGGVHMIYIGEHKFSQSKVGKDIDTPNYFMIAGTVRAKDGKPYTLYRDNPTVAAPAWLVEKIKTRANRPRLASNADAVSLDWFKRALAATPYTGGPAGLDNRHDYQLWLEFAMSCHEAAGGDETDYMWAFIEWSLADPSPDWKSPTSAEYVERKWQSFETDPPDGLSARVMAQGSHLLRSGWHGR